MVRVMNPAGQMSLMAVVVVVERVVVVARVVVVVECSSGCGAGAGSPMMVRVLNPAGQMSLMAVGADAPVPVGQPVVAIINTQGVSVNPADIDATAKGLSNILLIVGLHKGKGKVRYLTERCLHESDS